MSELYSYCSVCKKKIVDKDTCYEINISANWFKKDGKKPIKVNFSLENHLYLGGCTATLCDKCWKTDNNIKKALQNWVKEESKDLPNTGLENYKRYKYHLKDPLSNKLKKGQK